MNIPIEISSNRYILFIIDDYISAGFTDFDALKNKDKNALCALALNVLEHDDEIILSRLTNKFLSSYLNNKSLDNEIQLHELIADDVHDHYAEIFNYLFKIRLEHKDYNKKISLGMTPVNDSTTGEIMWI